MTVYGFYQQVKYAVLLSVNNFYQKAFCIQFLQTGFLYTISTNRLSVYNFYKQAFCIQFLQTGFTPLWY